MKQFSEAAWRMKKLGLSVKLADDFEKQGKVPVFEYGGKAEPAGESELAHIAQVQEDYGVLVYAIVRTDTAYGGMDAYLYVGSDPDEWVMEQLGLETGELYAYVENTDYPECSEFGLVGLDCTDGRLARIW